MACRFFVYQDGTPRDLETYRHDWPWWPTRERPKLNQTIWRKSIAELRINDSIRAKEVRVVAPDGSQVGVKSIQEALWLADQLGLDLVEVAPAAKPPVTRLMDYGKYKYELSVKEREARKKQTKSTVKEITFKVKIGDNDYRIKKDRAAKFLSHGDKVRVRIWFRGREASRPELGRRILDRMAEDLVHVGKIEQDAKQEGRNMTMSFAPLKKAEREAFAAAAARQEERDRSFEDAQNEVEEPEVAAELDQQSEPGAPTQPDDVPDQPVKDTAGLDVESEPAADSSANSET